MFHTRGFRGTRRRTIRPVIQSYKKVLIFADASFGAGFNNQFILAGVDDVAAGQTTPTDNKVPTGSIVKYFEIQFALANNVATPIYINCTIQYKLAGQSFIDPELVGGNQQRNQVLHMDLFSVGANQNSTHKFKFKVPKQFQRCRDGMQWAMVWHTTGTINNKTQIIYKFYR